MTLSSQQIEVARKVMGAYLDAPPGQNGRTLVECEAESDSKRISVIEGELRSLLQSYLQGQVPLHDFKSRIDSANKSKNLWGFRGMNSQMFFNMVVNVAGDEQECDEELKAAITVPPNEEIASSRIRNFARYVKRLGEEHVESGGSHRGKPRPGSIPFFLSYFWQIQDYESWPIYYTNSVNVMRDKNLWQPTGNLAEDYIEFKHIHEELADQLGIGLYEIEHMFWFKAGKQIDGYQPLQVIQVAEDTGSIQLDDLREVLRLPDSYVPPVVAILPRMARNEEELIQAAKASGTSLERAFEKSIDAAFTVLGYETKLLGQGQGRVPDGLAMDTDNSYVIIWDGKVRSNGYSMGTDDRIIREYIDRQSRELKQKRRFRNIYYFIISSSFADDYDEAIRSLKMDTYVNEVGLVEADALVEMVDARIRSPHQVTLGPDGLQRLFSISGVLSAEIVRETLM